MGARIIRWVYGLTMRGDWIGDAVAKVWFCWYCPYPINGHWTARSCIKAGECGCENCNRRERMMATMTLSGKCKGGPFNGQIMAHDAQTKELFEPRMEFSLSLRDPEIIPTKIGEYYWGKHGLWIWLPEGTRSRRLTT